MVKESNKKRIVTAYILCSIFFCSTVFGRNIDIFFNGINYLLSSLLLLILFLTIAIYFIKNIVIIIKNRKLLTLNLYLPAILYTITLLLCFILPSLENFESEPVLKAHYRGTQNQAYIKFRKDKIFQLNWSGFFGYNEWFTGKYIQKGDTLFLKYTNSMPGAFGTIILKRDRELITLDKRKDSTQYFVPFTIY